MPSYKFFCQTLSPINELSHRLENHLPLFHVNITVFTNRIILNCSIAWWVERDLCYYQLKLSFHLSLLLFCRHEGYRYTIRTSSLTSKEKVCFLILCYSKALNIILLSIIKPCRHICVFHKVEKNFYFVRIFSFFLYFFWKPDFHSHHQTIILFWDFCLSLAESKHGFSLGVFEAFKSCECSTINSWISYETVWY